jgi:hypothetical protein
MIEKNYSDTAKVVLGTGLFIVMSVLVNSFIGFFTFEERTNNVVFANTVYAQSPTPDFQSFSTVERCVPYVSDENSMLAGSIVDTIVSQSLSFRLLKPNESSEYRVGEQTLQALIVTQPAHTIPYEIHEPRLRLLAEEINLYFSSYSAYEYESREYTALDRMLSIEGLMFRIKMELHSRYRGQSHELIDITHLLEEFPATEGTIADRYIEVDKSQQKLYRWENGIMIQSNTISTGKYGPTYNGTHTILNHAKNAWSPVGNAWTPFWMAFAFNPDAGAWLGFHELPYWDGEDGEVIRRPFDTLGAPVTGGCIQLNIGDAEELYNWAENGTVVLIHD